VIEQMLSRLAAGGAPHQAFYLRTSDQYEIDLVLECGGRRFAFEIKLTSAPSSDDLNLLGKKAAMVKADAYYLVSRTRQPTTAANRGSVNLATCFELLDAL
jgi:predicted AAA+ superfamily ATPase